MTTTSDTSPSLGQRLRLARQVRELTQQELAAALAIDSTYLSKIENDRAQPSEELLYRIARELICDPDEFGRLAGRVPTRVRDALGHGGLDAAATKLSAADRQHSTGDALYDDIIAGLAGLSDGNLFEECACSLLRETYPTLACWPGGGDTGIDGMAADEEGRLHLVVTISERIIRNLTSSLKSYLNSGGTPCRVLLATSQIVPPAQRRKLEAIAADLGFRLINFHAREDFADRLYHNPRWLNRLLRLNGQPAALSVVPPRPRPRLTDTLIGRNQDLARLRNRTGDIVIVGQPGVGKTAAMAALVREGWGRFLVDTDPANVANALRRDRPRAVIVDDAAGHLDEIAMLLRMRAENESLDFALVATCWDGDEAAILQALSLGSSSVHRLELLTQDEIVEVITAVGLVRPHSLVQHIVEQARGRPGLATLLAHLAIRGEYDDYRDAVSGDAVRRYLLDQSQPGTAPETLQVLAVLSLAGDHGMAREEVAGLLGSTPAAIYSTLAPLAVGGVLEEQIRTERVVIWPETLRYSLIKKAFFGPHTLLSQRMLYSLPNQHALAHTLVGARLHGVQVPDDLLWDLVSKTGAAQREYIVLGPEYARRLLSHHPQALLHVAPEALEQAPELVLPRLMEFGVGDDRGIPQTIEHPLRKIADWIDRGRPGHREAIERRLVLLQAIQAWQETGTDIGVTGKTLRMALSARFHSSSMSPGSGASFVIVQRYLEPEQVHELTALWAQAESVIQGLDRAGLHGLLDVLREYVHPMSLSGPTPPEISEALNVVAHQALAMLATAAALEPGVLYEIRQLAGALRLDLQIQLDSDYEVVYPRLEPKRERDWQAYRDRHFAALGEVAHRYSNLSPAEVAERLETLLTKAPRNPPSFIYDAVSVLAEELAKRVADPAEWVPAILERPTIAWLVGGFLQRLMVLSAPAATQLLRLALEQPQAQAAAILQILRSPDPLDGLLEDVWELLPRYAEPIHVMSLRGEIPEATAKLLLEHDSPHVAAGVATGVWYDRKTAIPMDILPVWRAAILRAPIDRTDVGLVLKENQQLAREWLCARIEDRSIAGIVARHAYSVTEATNSLDSASRVAIIRVLIEQFDERDWFWVEDVARAVIASDLNAFESIVFDETLKRCHLLGLAGMPDEGWGTLALAALEAGYSEEDVVRVAYDMRTWSWTGSESAMWKDWESAFVGVAGITRSRDQAKNLDPRLLRVSDLGASIARKRADQAAQQERHEAIYGRH